MQMDKKKAEIKNLNAPKKITWAIAFLATIVGLIGCIIGFIDQSNLVASIIGFILLAGSSILMLLSSYLKGL